MTFSFCSISAIPNVPKNILVDFTLGESDVISMRVQWAIPEGWKKAHVYLEYRINYTAEGSNQDTVVSPHPAH